LPVAYFLHTAAAPPTAVKFDSRIEAWLPRVFGVEIDFAVNGTLGKLEGLGLLRRQQERLFVSPLDGALAQLRAVWDRLLGSGRKPRTNDRKPAWTAALAEAGFRQFGALHSQPLCDIGLIEL
jgi:hypothetical protein